LPTQSSNTPEIAAVFHCAIVGGSPVRRRKIGYSANPTEKCRIPAKISGGNDSTPTFIAKNVPPHKKYTAAKFSTRNAVHEDSLTVRESPFPANAGFSERLSVEARTYL
jgi:hypothetical protein